MSGPESESGPRFYGRRKGRPLRVQKQALIETLLPRLALPSGEGPLDLSRYFDPGQAEPGRQGQSDTWPETWLEIGFGGGEHLAEQAQARPETCFIGAEPFVNGVASLLTHIDAGAIKNIRLWPDDVRLLLKRLPDASIDQLVILFPDPWPKKRHWGRRIIGPETIPEFSRILKPGGRLRVATDHAGYLEWILALLCPHTAFSWLAERPEDWRVRPDLPEDPWPATRYERKSLAGKPHYLVFEKR